MFRIISFTLILCVQSLAASADEDTPPRYVLEHFAKSQSDEPEAKEEPLEISKISYESKDLDKDGSVEWFLYTSLLCGSGGCMGPVYSKKGEAYCFVAWAHTSDFRKKGAARNLNCGDIDGYPRVFLGELIK